MPLINNKTTDDPQHLLKYLRLINIKPAFPNIENVLQIYLTTPCINCNREQFFSELK